MVANNIANVCCELTNNVMTLVSEMLLHMYTQHGQSRCKMSYFYLDAVQTQKRRFLGNRRVRNVNRSQRDAIVRPSVCKQFNTILIFVRPLIKPFATG